MFSNFLISAPPTLSHYIDSVYIFTWVHNCGGWVGGWGSLPFHCNCSQLMCPPSHLLSNFNRLLPPHSQPVQYRDSTNIFYVGNGGVGGGGGGNPSLLFTMTQWGVARWHEVLQQFSWNSRFIFFHPSKDCYVSLCGVWGVYYFCRVGRPSVILCVGDMYVKIMILFTFLRYSLLRE